MIIKYLRVKDLYCQKKLKCIKTYKIFFMKSPFFSGEDNQHANDGLIDMGLQSGHNAHNICPEGFDLPVIRSQDELERIENYLGDAGTQGLLMCWKNKIELYNTKDYAY